MQTGGSLEACRLRTALAIKNFSGGKQPLVLVSQMLLPSAGLSLTVTRRDRFSDIFLGDHLATEHGETVFGQCRHLVFARIDVHRRDEPYAVR